MRKITDENLRKYCETFRQREAFEIVMQCNGDIQRAAKMMGVKVRGVQQLMERIIRNALERGYDSATGRDFQLPSGFVASGYSELIKADEDDPLNRIVYWVKSNRKLVDQLEECRSVIEAMADDLPKLKPSQYLGNVKTKNHFTVIPIGDPHIGLRTWSREVGIDWDVKIAQRVYANVFNRLLKRTPDTNEVVVFNSGDFFHADNIRGETERSGHKLDLDGRPSYWLEAGVGIMKMLLSMCLEKYSKVHFVSTPGNHDDMLGQALGISIKHIYEAEPRLTTQIEPNPFQYVERGNILLGFCHGHSCRLAALPGKMADDQNEAWGRTSYRHWFTGHVHHNQWIQFKEHPGCTVESVGILPPRDAYAYGAAYGGSRGTQLCVFDQHKGYMPDRFTETVLPSD